MNSCNVNVDLDDWLEQTKFDIAEDLRQLSKADLKIFYEIAIDLFGKGEADAFMKREGLEL
jgi:hypothetical protein